MAASTVCLRGFLLEPSSGTFARTQELRSCVAPLHCLYESWGGGSEGYIIVAWPLGSGLNDTRAYPAELQGPTREGGGISLHRMRSHSTPYILVAACPPVHRFVMSSVGHGSSAGTVARVLGGDAPSSLVRPKVQCICPSGSDAVYRCSRVRSAMSRPVPGGVSPPRPKLVMSKNTLRKAMGKETYLVSTILFFSPMGVMFLEPRL
ncbi:hypothetical protein LX36DRAFT_466299 [Colletotrichum falcatum]|nr:hypothetical protein LX36DRAFT_466299 [Colletotrichum falcatum]